MRTIDHVSCPCNAVTVSTRTRDAQRCLDAMHDAMRGGGGCRVCDTRLYALSCTLEIIVCGDVLVGHGTELTV